MSDNEFLQINKQEYKETEQIKPQENITGKKALDYAFSKEQPSLEKTENLGSTDNLKNIENQHEQSYTGKQALDYAFSKEQPSLEKTENLESTDNLKNIENQHEQISRGKQALDYAFSDNPENKKNTQDNSDTSGNNLRDNHISEVRISRWVSVEKIDASRTPLQVQEQLATLLERWTPQQEDTAQKSQELKPQNQPEKIDSEVQNQPLEVKNQEQLRAEAKDTLPQEYHHLLDGAKIISVKFAEQVNQELKESYLKNVDNKPEKWQNPYEPGTKVVEYISGKEIKGSQVHGNLKEINQDKTNQSETVVYKSMDYVSDVRIKEDSHLRLGRINSYKVPTEGNKVNDKEIQASKYGEMQPFQANEQYKPNTGYQIEILDKDLSLGKKLVRENTMPLARDYYQ